MLLSDVHGLIKIMVPPSLRILPVDLSDPSATRAATEKAKALFGGIDILINNAGKNCMYMYEIILPYWLESTPT